MATAHLVHGFLGVGKTTFAKQLERRLPAIRFTHDEWMVRFYGTDPPAHLFETYSRAVTEQIDLLWPRCLELGVDVVLDWGFWSRVEGDETVDKARGCGGDAVLYRVTCPEHVARARLRARNENLDIDLLITVATYETLKARFEPLAPEEKRQEVDGLSLLPRPAASLASAFDPFLPLARRQLSTVDVYSSAVGALGRDVRFVAYAQVLFSPVR